MRYDCKPIKEYHIGDWVRVRTEEEMSELIGRPVEDMEDKLDWNPEYMKEYCGLFGIVDSFETTGQGESVHLKEPPGMKYCDDERPFSRWFFHAEMIEPYPGKQESIDTDEWSMMLC